MATLHLQDAIQPNLPTPFLGIGKQVLLECLKGFSKQLLGTVFQISQKYILMLYTTKLQLMNELRLYLAVNILTKKWKAFHQPIVERYSMC